MHRTSRALLAVVCAALLAACGGGNGDALPIPVASVTPATDASGAPLQGLAADYQAALDRFDAKRATLRGARALSASRFNETEGTDREVALTLVLAACADLRTAYIAFEAEIRKLTFPDSAATPLSTLFAQTEVLAGIIALYATASEGGQFQSINNEETPATVRWERTADELAALVGAPGLRTKTPPASGAPTASATPTATPEP